MSLRTCLKCGWVHFGVSRTFAEKEIKEFNDFFDKSTHGVRELYGNKKTSMVEYDRCGACGNSYENFRDSIEGDCPEGSTLGPILKEGE